MTVRTTSRMVTFTHPFNLSGVDEVQPAGTYTVETDEELLQTLSVPAYRRISTLMRLPARPTGPMLTQIVEINAVELAAVLARDAQPNENNTATDARRRCRAPGRHCPAGWSHP
jgi:hypothetical protein